MIAGLVLGLAAVGPPAPAETPHAIVLLGWDAQTRSCQAKVNGVEIGDPGTDAGAAALTRALSDGQRIVQLQGLKDVPYACADIASEAIRRSGHAIKVGFLSEPSPFVPASR